MLQVSHASLRALPPTRNGHTPPSLGWPRVHKRPSSDHFLVKSTLLSLHQAPPTPKDDNKDLTYFTVTPPPLSLPRKIKRNLAAIAAMIHWHGNRRFIW